MDQGRLAGLFVGAVVSVAANACTSTGQTTGGAGMHVSRIHRVHGRRRLRGESDVPFRPQWLRGPCACAHERSERGQWRSRRRPEGRSDEGTASACLGDGRHRRSPSPGARAVARPSRGWQTVESTTANAPSPSPNVSRPRCAPRSSEGRPGAHPSRRSSPLSSRRGARNITACSSTSVRRGANRARRFHQAVLAGELDSTLDGVHLIEFDLDADREPLDAAGYASRLIPLFALPNADGTASEHRIEGSVKGPAAVEQNLMPRLQAFLPRPVRQGMST